jgi:hypothetical protein
MRDEEFGCPGDGEEAPQVEIDLLGSLETDMVFGQSQDDSLAPSAEESWLN